MRLAIGFLALGFMLLAELSGKVIMYQQGLDSRIFDTEKISGGISAASLIAFGLMPWFLMVFGEKEDVVIQESLHQKNKMLALQCQ